MDNVEKSEMSLGAIKISDDVVSVIAGLAATEVEGVAAMSGGLAGGIAEILGRKNLAKGVKVEVGDKEATIDLFIIVEYGTQMPELGAKVQKNVKKAIENMTGLSVVIVNVHIQGVVFPVQEKVEEQSE